MAPVLDANHGLQEAVKRLWVGRWVPEKQDTGSSAAHQQCNQCHQQAACIDHMHACGGRLLPGNPPQ